MPRLKDGLHFGLLRHLDCLYLELLERHYAAAPRGGIPAGGGDWMDLFFRCEALRGCMGALRRGVTEEEAIEEGKAVSTFAVQVWNEKREYQVRRWENTAHDYLESCVRQYRTGKAGNRDKTSL